MRKTPSTARAANNGVGYEWEYAKPQDDRTRWEKIKHGIWNPETHQFLGRTAKSWGGIITFYIIFYGCLAVFFAICMKVLLSTIDDHEPKWQLEDSIIGTNPGMGFRPMPGVDEGSLIWYQARNTSNVETWSKSLDLFLHNYNNSDSLPGHGHNQMICDYNIPPQPGKVCAVDINSASWGPCIHKANYSYSRSSPCIFLKLNRIYGWMPDFYNDKSNLPQQMPDSLKSYIKNVTDEKKLNTIWVDCYGEAPADKEHIGEIKYYPQRGFPGYFYPYINTEGYLSPLVAVQLLRPKLNTLINIECRAWAKNINYRRSLQNREGSVHFEVMID
ncbi:sodium/potassium-transporting ATPase subunit beta-2-like [Lycorma delicatula]|uniref:sodium/potassium-transporting ATPase subunit beta-2-like n=1 Tax=Lycorma delicatula TaxID=130591 RepID=UPI003F5151E7